jgi:hypothetical protein
MYWWPAQAPSNPNNSATPGFTRLPRRAAARPNPNLPPICSPTVPPQFGHVTFMFPSPYQRLPSRVLKWTCFLTRVGFSAVNRTLLPSLVVNLTGVGTFFVSCASKSRIAIGISLWGQQINRTSPATFSQKILFLVKRSGPSSIARRASDSG